MHPALQLSIAGIDTPALILWLEGEFFLSLSVVVVHFKNEWQGGMAVICILRGQQKCSWWCTSRNTDKNVVVEETSFQVLHFFEVVLLRSCMALNRSDEFIDQYVGTIILIFLLCTCG